MDPASDATPEDAAVASPPPWKPYLRRGCGCVLVLLVALLLAAPVLASVIPDLLTERSEPARADALVVLAGDHRGGRVDAALELWKRGHVPEGPFVVSGGQLYCDTSWAQLMAARAEAGGVPAARIRRQDRSRTTEEDARFTAELLQLPAGSRVLLVTSPWHSGRAAEHFREAFGPEVEVLSCPSAERPDPWWESAEDTRALATEVLKRLWPGEGG